MSILTRGLHYLALASFSTTLLLRQRTASEVSSIVVSRPAMLRYIAYFLLILPLTDMIRNRVMLASKISRTDRPQTSTALEFPLTGMKMSALCLPSLVLLANESQDLARHFLPYRAVSTKICRDIPSGVSKEVGFAR